VPAVVHASLDALRQSHVQGSSTISQSAIETRIPLQDVCCDTVVLAEVGHLRRANICWKPRILVIAKTWDVLKLQKAIHA